MASLVNVVKSEDYAPPLPPPLRFASPALAGGGSALGGL